VEGVSALISFRTEKIWKKIIILAVGGLLVYNFSSNSLKIFKARAFRCYDQGDAVFKMVAWMKDNVPAGANIACAPLHQVYLPAEYKNVHVYKGFMMFDAEDFNAFIDKYRPEYLYYDQGPCAGDGLPFNSIDEVLVGKKAILLAEFDSREATFTRFKGDRFMFYRIIYDE